MTTKGNRGFAASVVDLVTADDAPETSAADGIMDSRSATLSRLATGKVVTDRTEFVDPARCRPWRLHNRDLGKLNESNCADLIEAFMSAGRQRIPAIVRRLRDDPDHDFEIIAGVRRWWTTRWLREHHHPEFEYLVTIQNMTDEEAFRVADLENRSRRDISPIERAQDYLRAIGEFYEGSQDAMADRLNVSKSWLSRILDVGRLPPEIVAAYADSHEISVAMAKKIAPLAKAKETAARLVHEAQQIGEDRKAGVEIDAQEVTRRLVASAIEKQSKPRPESGELSSANGRPMLKFTKARRGGAFDIKVLPRSGASNSELMKAIEQILESRAP
jgi:ParB family transcriptional regulator, chromosome partitioning protein